MPCFLKWVPPGQRQVGHNIAHSPAGTAGGDGKQTAALGVGGVSRASVMVPTWLGFRMNLSSAWHFSRPSEPPAVGHNEIVADQLDPLQLLMG